MRSVDHLLRYREAHPEYEERRLEGLRNSQKLKESARRISFEFRSKAQESRSKNPRHQKGQFHIASKHWRLRDFKGRIYEFVNLANFIRENPGLFDENDTQWHRPPGKTSSICRAYSGLSSIRPFPVKTRSKRKVAGSWKGWTWFSQTERIKNNGSDLLHRQ